MKTLLHSAGLLLIVATSTVSAQVCVEEMQETTPTSRFILQEDQVTDTKTNLIWQRCLFGQTWNSAAQTCEGSQTLNKWNVALESVPEGWRIPNIRELTSITEFRCAQPAMNLTVFPGATGVLQWSSTPMVNAGRFSPGEQRVWAISSGTGRSFSAIKNSYFGYGYRLVKEGN